MDWDSQVLRLTLKNNNIAYKVHDTIPVQCFLSFHEHSNCKCFCPMAQPQLTFGLAELCVICPGMSVHIVLCLSQVLTVMNHQCQLQGFAESTWKWFMTYNIIPQSIHTIVVSETSTSITDLYEYQFLSDKNTQCYTANRLQVKSLERAKQVDKCKSEEFREQSD